MFLPFRTFMRLKAWMHKTLPAPVFDFCIFVWRAFLRVAFQWRTKRFSGEMLRTVHYGALKYDLYIDPSNGFVDQTIYANGIFEPEIHGIIAEYADKDGVFIDVGSNIGQYANFWSQLFREVHAYEPVPKLYQQCLHSVEANGFTNVHIHQLAVGESEGVVQVYCNPENMGGSSVMHKYEQLPPVDVPVRALDTELANVAWRISLIKMDIEWYEWKAFLWMSEILKRHAPVIIFEYSPLFLSEYFWPQCPVELLDFLSNHGYDLHEVFDDGKREPIPGNDWTGFLSKFDTDYRQTNILCLPKRP